MKKVIIHDHYMRIKDEQGNVLHEVQQSDTVALNNATFAQACDKVSEIFGESKFLGESYETLIDQSELGLVQVIVNFADGRKLRRIIYLKDV